MEVLSYRLPSFEGPLDLLLHLIAKQKLHICEVRISSLLEQYLEYVDAMREQDMEVDSAFLEMASRLVYIKTVFLLPKHEEAEVLEEELATQLLEYQACKEMAVRFAQQFSSDHFVRAAMQMPKDSLYHRRHDPQELLKAYKSAVGRGKRFAPPPIEKIAALVSRRIVSVPSQIVSVLKQLRRKGKIDYAALYAGKEEKTEKIATFLAVLELVKNRRILITDTAHGSVVTLLQREAHR